jgi:hypothetical protein
MAASKKRVSKKSKPAPRKETVERAESAAEDGVEMDSDELDLLFWGSTPYQDSRPKYSDN